MDHYIGEFQKYMGTCMVRDYAVYVQKEKGFARFNPFSVTQQMVIYITDRGCYCCLIQGLGEFTQPVSLEAMGLQISIDGRLATIADRDKVFGYVRKYKSGAYASPEQFAAVVRGEDC